MLCWNRSLALKLAGLLICYVGIEVWLLSLMFIEQDVTLISLIR
uniref:Uncharacterized protein n=1 Tax=Arundo donax TaxID=35708 RepID=A0A0A9FYH7_ARUDO